MTDGRPAVTGLGPVPETLDWLAGTSDGARWLAGLPGLAVEAVDRFGVVPDGSLLAGMVSLVVPAVTAAGREVVVKVRWPHVEAEREAAALRLWDGNGAVRLLGEAPDLDALLLERCVPGSPITVLGSEAATRVVAGLVDLTAVPAPPGMFTPLSAAAADWVDDLTVRAAALEGAGHETAARVARTAAATAARLSATQAGQAAVVINEDLHPDNVLLSDTGWRVIDPKPLAGERAAAAARWVWDWGCSEVEELRPWRVSLGPTFDPVGRCRLMAGLLGVDLGRLAGWGFVSAARAAVWWPGPAGVVGGGWVPTSALAAAGALAGLAVRPRSG